MTLQCERKKIEIIARGYAIEGASNRSTLLEILSRPGDLPHLSWHRHFLTAKVVVQIELRRMGIKGERDRGGKG